jgi:hypothetical protein
MMKLAELMQEDESIGVRNNSEMLIRGASKSENPAQKPMLKVSDSQRSKSSKLSASVQALKQKLAIVSMDEGMQIDPREANFSTADAPSTEILEPDANLTDTAERHKLAQKHPAEIATSGTHPKYPIRQSWLKSTRKPSQTPKDGFPGLKMYSIPEVLQPDNLAARFKRHG